MYHVFSLKILKERRLRLVGVSLLQLGSHLKAVDTKLLKIIISIKPLVSSNGEIEVNSIKRCEKRLPLK